MVWLCSFILIIWSTFLFCNLSKIPSGFYLTPPSSSFTFTNLCSHAWFKSNAFTKLSLLLLLLWLLWFLVKIIKKSINCIPGPALSLSLLELIEAWTKNSKINLIWTTITDYQDVIYNSNNNNNINTKIQN